MGCGPPPYLRYGVFTAVEQNGSEKVKVPSSVLVRNASDDSSNPYARYSKVRHFRSSRARSLKSKLLTSHEGGFHIG